ncbi:MAG: hypothetical protein A2Y14_05685 [Verrucomicrobia bacterium GWF2_51_19]|nr:MAG: hypothetical protein A2Y14_05685 [Verrucomicrobia bacterium GWF2_51_19]
MCLTLFAHADPNLDLLFKEAMTGDMAALIKYLKAGGDINKQDNRGNTLLHAEVAKKSCVKEKIKSLLEKGARINIKNNNGKTPLDALNANSFIKEKHKNCLTYFLQLDWLFENGLQGSLPDIKKYLKAGGDINRQDENGCTFLHAEVARQSCVKKKIEFLIENGSKVYLKDNEGKTPLDVLFDNSLQESKKSDMVDFLKDQMFLEVMKGDMSVIATYLKSGGDINLQDENGYTLLHVEIKKPVYLEENIQFFIKNSININAQENLGRTALFLAMACIPNDQSERRLNVIECLLTLGADWRIPTFTVLKGSKCEILIQETLTPSEYAKQNGMDDILELFEKYPMKD